MWRTTQMTHEWLDTPLHQLNDNALMQLKLEMSRNIKMLADELKLREMAQESTGIFTSW